MEEKKYSLYVHINKDDNQKAYVGISVNPKKRWGKNGEGYKGQFKFYNAIKKYGWDNFKHIILLKDLSLEEAWAKEKEYIKKFDSINDGYNVFEGGQIIVTDEMRKKGYITKKLKESSVIITLLSSGKSLFFDTVLEASKKTGISEHWFYRYYRGEIDTLNNIDISFGIEPSRYSFKQLEDIWEKISNK